MSNELLFWAIEKGVGFLGDAIEQSVDSKRFHKKMCHVISKSVKSAMKECGKEVKWNVLDNYKLMKFLSKQDIIEPHGLMGNAIKDMMQEYFNANKKKKAEITEAWIKDFSVKYVTLCSQSPVLSHYILLCAIEEAQRKEEYAAGETYDLINCIKQDIDFNRNTNMYDGIDMVNRTLYPFIFRRLTKGCSSSLLELGYGLTDIYDHISQYDKSVELVNLILKVEKDTYRPMTMKHLRTLIGCTYSLVIAKEENIVKKEKTLGDAQEAFQEIDAEIQKWKGMDNVDNVEKLFIEGLYQSDVGALHTNLADLALKKGDEKEQRNELEKALGHQRLGEKAREKLVRMVEEGLDSELSFDAKKRLYQSKSNIAGIYFRLGDYDKALEMHEEILHYRKSSGAESDIMLTKTYIAGCYLKKRQNKPLQDKEKNVLYTYLDECKNYYQKNEDKMRLDNIIKMAEDFKKLDD